MSNLLKIISLALFVTAGTACTVSYTTSGASIPPEAKTISVNYFPNRAPLVEPTLSQMVTETLKDEFSSRTNLDLVSRSGDLHFEGEIVDYKTEPVAIQQDDQAAQTRLTITVRVKYTNRFDSKYEFDTNFSRYVDYSSSQTTANQNQIQEIVDLIAEDVFNKSVVNW